MSNTYLKMKIMSLAAEGRIIRYEEKRHWPGPSDMRRALHEHRLNVVRPEARAALLAYGYLRHRRYTQIEAKAYSQPNWTRAAQIASKFGGVKVDADTLIAWAFETAASSKAA